MQEKRICNQEGRDLIKANHVCKLEAYKRLDGEWAIGWDQRGKDVKEGTVWTQQQADVAFEAAIKECDAAINSYVTVPLNENQHSALVSLFYSVEEGSFPKSRMLEYLNEKKFDKAAADFPTWKLIWTGEKDDKGEKIYKVSQPFVTHRHQERALFETVPKLPANPKKVDSASPSAAALSSSLNVNQVEAASNNVVQGNFSESIQVPPASYCSLSPVEPELPPASTSPSAAAPAANPADLEEVDAQPADSEAVDANSADSEAVGSAPPASPSAAVADLSITITVRPPTPVQHASCLLQPVQLMLSLAPTPAAAPAAALSLQLSIII